MGTSCALSAVERQKIQQWIAAHGTPQQVAMRCRIVLAAAAGESNVAIAERLSVNRNTVILWRKRFAVEGLDGLWNIAPGRGRKPKYQIDKIAAIVDATLQTKRAGMTHWSCRTMAQSQGVSKSTVNNIWRAHKLQPHRTKTFKLSRDPKFLEKMTDVVGLYLNPPQQALVICVDEKSQIQALDRTHPGLPIKKGRCGTMPTITNVTAPPPSLQLWRHYRERSLGNAMRDTGIRTFCDSCVGSTLLLNTLCGLPRYATNGTGILACVSLKSTGAHGAIKPIARPEKIPM